MQLIGKFVRCSPGQEELPFLYDTETLADTDDADAQEQPLGAQHGAAGVNALWNPRRYRLAGKLLTTVGEWFNETDFGLGDVLEFSGWYWQNITGGRSGALPPAGFGGPGDIVSEHPDDYTGAWAPGTGYTGDEHITDSGERSGMHYRAAGAGTSGAAEPIWFRGDVADNGITWVWDGDVWAVWERRGSLYECTRWLRDQYDKFFHSGILKVFLEDDRYHFAQCVSRTFAPIGNVDVAVEFDATFSAFDPRRYSTTLETAAPAVGSVQTLWAPDATVALDDLRLMPSDSGRAYVATTGGRTGPQEPHGPFTAPAWEALTVYAIGDRVRPPSAPNGYVYRCTRAGTSGATPPTFTAGVVEDPNGGGCQWTAEQAFVDDFAPRWAAEADYELNDVIRPTTPNGWLYVCTVPGTSGASEPAPWAVVENNTTVSGTATFQAHRAAVWQYDSTANQHTVLTNLAYAGNAPGAPVIALTVPAAALNIVVCNHGTGDSFSLRGECPAAGVLTVDCDAGTVILGGPGIVPLDVTDLFDGSFLTLEPGVQNRIQVAWNEPGPTVIGISHRPRYW